MNEQPLSLEPDDIESMTLEEWEAARGGSWSVTDLARGC